jgi:hypothetical protein
VRRETGKEQVVKVHYNEGVAIRIGPEPCAGAREGIGEASGRGMRRPAIEPRKTLFSGADAVLLAEGNTDGRVSASARTARRGRRPWHVQTLLVREPGYLTVGQQQRCSVLSWSASGRRGAVADDARA